MKLSVFLELVEIKAKTASIFPFLLGICYAYYHYKQLNWLNLLLFFVAMLLFNMAVDINDNYWDYRNAEHTSSQDFRQKTNVIGVNHLNIKKIGWLNYSLMLIAAIIGIWLVIRVGWLLLILGIFCFAVGFLYAGGPKPLNSLPLGEFFAGFTMGFMIFLLAVLINVYPQVPFDWQFIGPILLTSGLSACAIASLLLANNICDYQEDIDLGRHTIVRYLGVHKSLILYVSFWIIGYFMLIVAVICHFAPWTLLLTLLITPILFKNTKQFFAVHIKKQTFPLAIKNLFIATLTQVLCFALGLFI
ncbi:1,4-dihydroxy-2-naphthoate polyprenyltransferase [Bombilactobacillus thymidiniphilus]|uniref:1,4-dihydroxy-2-naphthoate polyprenyltransferase n=1 Tax=Bombilactobacillus thymidiniphilus TaxID=2923363 RepID=A0ABY4PBD2_9LACO|nr:1,4-dihydroxy-2-naphthoate polyprenyltransferase [Bombilactobacillus thymidiniphilus]UQS82973.1 1,4-dihydroxy-2-naphthoate polyprenyltransferase [Bombilactobacillus thymidiniphilus]